MHVTPFLRAWAASNIFANLDSYIGSGHNYYVYHDSITNKFNWITWDVNEAFGNFTQGMNVTQIEQMALNYTGSGANNRPLCNKIIANTTLYSAYLNEVCYLTNVHFTQAYWFSYIDSLENRIKADVYADPNKFFTNAQFDANIDTLIVVPGNPGGSNINGLKSFMNHRRSSLITQLAANNCFVGLNSNTVEINTLSIKPNPNSGRVLISINDPKQQILFYDVLGKPVDVKIVSSLSENEIYYSFEDLPKGIYFCKTGDQVKRIVYH